MRIDKEIKKKADDIRNKIYGKEVRESLASGLETMSSDVVENEGRQSVVEGRQDSVESQWQNVVDETTNLDVVSAPEIIAARDGESNLKARLDKENQEVTTQLAHKPNKNDLFIDVKDYGAKGDGVTDDTQSIKNAISDLRSGMTLYFPRGRYIVSETLQPTVSNITIKGQYSNISSPRDLDIVIWRFSNLINVNMDGLASDNTINAQTWIKATSTHHLHVTNCATDGMKLGFDLSDCYWTKIESVRMQSVYQAFKFIESTNAFSVINLSVAGAGTSSLINRCIGGVITGSSFEGLSGRLMFRTSTGVSITGNYFEGYEHSNQVINYIEIGTTNYKDCYGFDITGNLFYPGALSSILLYNVAGINITGNSISTTHALNLYCHNASNQTDINYTANHFKGTEEFNIQGDESKALITPHFKKPLLLKNNNFFDYTLLDEDMLIGNKNGRLIAKTKDKTYSITTKLSTSFAVDADGEYKIDLELTNKDVVDVFIYSDAINGVYGLYKIFKTNNVVKLIKVDEKYSTLNNTVTVSSEGVLTFKNGDASWGATYRVNINR